MHGQDQHARLRARSQNLTDDFAAVWSGHREIHQDDVGLQLAGLLQDFHTVAGFTRDRHVALDLEEHAESGPQDGMIIGDQESNWSHGDES